MKELYLKYRKSTAGSNSASLKLTQQGVFVLLFEVRTNTCLLHVCILSRACVFTHGAGGSACMCVCVCVCVRVCARAYLCMNILGNAVVLDMTKINLLL